MASTTIRALPPALRDRLNKLLLLLGSDQAGESSAAAGKITALLKEHGLDWHDLVGSIGEAARSAPHKPPPQAKAPGGQQVMSAAALHQLIHQILRSPINQRARRFLAGMQDHADTFGSVKFSDKQWHWLMDLARRAK
jgi:1,6-anhydro-N-acetylmuramate kinase